MIKRAGTVTLPKLKVDESYVCGVIDHNYIDNYNGEEIETEIETAKFKTFVENKDVSYWVKKVNKFLATNTAYPLFVVSKKTKVKEDQEGYYGCYYQYSKFRGVKAILFDLGRKLEKIDFNDEDIKYALVSTIMEFFIGCKVKENYKKSPKYYGVCVVQVKGKYYFGLIMQHLGDKLLSKVGVRKLKSLSKTFGFDLCDDGDVDNYIVEGVLESTGLYLSDVHLNNIILFKNDLFVIDFSPNRIILMKEVH